MSLIPAATYSFAPGGTILSAQVNANFDGLRTAINSSVMFRDVAADVTVTHTFENVQHFNAGVALVGGSSNLSVGGTASVAGVLTATGGVVGALTGNVTGNVTGALTGNADTATKLATTRAIALGGVLSGTANFDGSAGITITAVVVAGSFVNADISAAAAIVDTKLATIATAGKVSNSATTGTSANTASTLVLRDGSGNFTAGTITATALTLNGVAYTFPSGHGTNGQALTEDGSGGLTWTTISGGGGGGSGTVTSSTIGQLAAYTAATTVTGSTFLTVSGTTLTVSGTVAATTLTGNGSGVTSLNAGNIASGTVTVGHGGTGSSSTPANGAIPIGNATNYTITTITAGTGISVTNGAGSITIAATGISGTTGRLAVYTSASAIGNSVIRDDGTNVGVGVTPATYAFRVNGDIYASADVISFSDERHKFNIVSRAPRVALETLRGIRAVSFDWRNGGRRWNIGFLAQEVEKLLPEVVRMEDDGKLGLVYPGIVAELWAAVRAIDQRLIELEPVAI